MTEILIGIVSMLLGIALIVAPWAMHHVVSAVKMTAAGASAAVTVVFGAVLIHDATDRHHQHSMVLAPLDAGAWVRRVASLETRVPVEVTGTGTVTLSADSDQLEQLHVVVTKPTVLARADVDHAQHAALDQHWHADHRAQALLFEQAVR